jgi:hypothetical protein
MPLVPLIGSPFVPTTSIAGHEPTSIFRGVNAVVRNLTGSPYIECYAGSKDLGEDYNLAAELLTTAGNKITWTAGSSVVNIASGAALTELRPGQMFLAGTEAFVVERVVGDTEVRVVRPPATSQAAPGPDGYYLPVLFEIGKQRGSLRRGNAIPIERQDIIFVGQGTFRLNGVSTGFTATRQPKRLERSSAGTYTEVPLGFPDAPPAPTLAVATNGWKGMIGNAAAGGYSFMAAYWNVVTDGHSNPCEVIKQDAGGVNLVLAADGRFSVDATTLIAAKPTNATGLKMFGSLSGGGVSTVNTSNFHEGAWYDCASLPFDAKTATALDAAADTLTIANHAFKEGDYVIYKRTGGADIGGLLSGTVHGLAPGPSYWVLVKDKDTIQLASSAANFKTKTVVDITGAFPAGTHTFGLFDNNDVAYFEYLDTETGNIASGDNNRPPECEWIIEFANQLFFISTYGNVTATNAFGTSLGNFVVPGKSANREAAPARWRVTVEDTITGFAKGIGRLFCLTPTGLPFITPTGRTELARLTGVPLDLPFVSRPFWTKGGVSPYNITVIQGDVYGYSGNMPLRSPSQNGEQSAPFEIGRPIMNLLRNVRDTETPTVYRDIPDGHVLTVHDPKNNQFILILSAVRKNAQGYWESEIIPLDLSTNPPHWQPKVLLTSTTRDMIVSGAAIINNRLEYLAGGRVSGGTFQMKTYRYDERLGSGSIPWSVAFQPTDGGEESRAKFIRSFRATGRLSTPIVQVHGTDWDTQSIDEVDIERGLNSLSGNISLTDTGGLRKRSFRKKHYIKDLALFTVRISGTWVDTGTNVVDTLDELVVDVGVHGAGQ